MQVNPASADEVEMDSMWSRIGGNRGESILDDKTVCCCVYTATSPHAHIMILIMLYRMHCALTCFG